MLLDFGYKHRKLAFGKQDKISCLFSHSYPLYFIPSLTKGLNQLQRDHPTQKYLSN